MIKITTTCMPMINVCKLLITTAKTYKCTEANAEIQYTFTHLVY